MLCDADQNVTAVEGYVRGRVQGVGFRRWLQQQARSLKLAGWVCNCPNGEVRFKLFGCESAIQACLQKCHIGPRFARVDAVDVNPVSTNVHDTQFRILRDCETA